jgi:hypothetical protein
MTGPRVLFVARSGTSKLGALASSYSAPSTCPPSCPLQGKACYARGIRTLTQWKRTEGAGNPLNVSGWAAFCRKVSALPAGSLFRHNVAGDLPGRGETVDGPALRLLVDACRSAQLKAWTYTHKKPEGTNLTAIRAANAGGLTVNLSADTPEEADAFRGLGPVCLTVPSAHPAKSATPGGTPIVVCPAQLQPGRVTCSNCGGSAGPLCSRPDRTFVVGFRAHGQAKRALDSRLTGNT